MSDRYFEITYSTGEVVKVKPVPRSKLADLIALQKSLLTTFLYEGGLTGELLLPTNEHVWADIRRVALMLPLVGGGELNIDLIEDSDRLIEVFFTTTTNRHEETGAVVPVKNELYSPSEISKLHGLNFFEKMWEARKEALKMMEKDETPEIAPEELKVETPMPIPLAS